MNKGHFKEYMISKTKAAIERLKKALEPAPIAEEHITDEVVETWENTDAEKGKEPKEGKERSLGNVGIVVKKHKRSRARKSNRRKLH